MTEKQRPVLRYEEIRVRFPRLLRAMMWVACLSSSEAESCIQGYLEGREYTGEAVGHFGGASAVIKAAVRPNARKLVYGRHLHVIGDE